MTASEAHFNVISTTP